MSSYHFNQLLLFPISISAVGIIGNAFAILILVPCKNKQVYEIFCIGLALSDMVFLLSTVPITMMHYIFRRWIFGKILCKLLNYAVYVTLYTASLMLFGLTTSRFIAITLPWTNRTMSLRDAKLICVIIWICGFAFAAPIPVYYTLRTSTNGTNFTVMCIDDYPFEALRASYQLFTVAVTYVAPFSTIIGMNTKIIYVLRKKEQMDLLRSSRSRSTVKKQRLIAKVTKLIIFISSMYCICWLPTHIINTWFNVARSKFLRSNWMRYLKIISQTLSYFSCCVNFIVYSTMSSNFRVAFHKQFPRLNQFLGRYSNYKLEEETMKINPDFSGSIKVEACRTFDHADNNIKELK